MGDLTTNFSRYEFACKDHCGFDNVSPRLVRLIQEIRDEIGEPVIIYSGCRCEKWNKEQGGVADSGHLTGESADIYVDGMRSEELGNIIRDMYRRGKLRDLTYCYRPGYRTVHVGVDRKPRKQIFNL